MPHPGFLAARLHDPQQPLQRPAVAVQQLVSTTDLAPGAGPGAGEVAKVREAGEEWLKPAFDLGKIPEVPPPQEVCY